MGSGQSDANEAAPGRGFGFPAVLPIFDGLRLEVPDGRKDYGEERIIAIGLVGTQCLVAVYTRRGTNRRIISARFADRAERRAYRVWSAAQNAK